MLRRARICFASIGSAFYPHRHGVVQGYESEMGTYLYRASQLDDFTCITEAALELHWLDDVAVEASFATVQ